MAQITNFLWEISRTWNEESMICDKCFTKSSAHRPESVDCLKTLFLLCHSVAKECKRLQKTKSLHKQDYGRQQSNNIRSNEIVRLFDMLLQEWHCRSLEINDWFENTENVLTHSNEEREKGSLEMVIFGGDKPSEKVDVEGREDNIRNHFSPACHPPRGSRTEQEQLYWVAMITEISWDCAKNCCSPDTKCWLHFCLRVGVHQNLLAPGLQKISRKKYNSFMWAQI